MGCPLRQALELLQQVSPDAVSFDTALDAAALCFQWMQVSSTFAMGTDGNMGRMDIDHVEVHTFKYRELDYVYIYTYRYNQMHIMDYNGRHPPINGLY